MTPAQDEATTIVSDPKLFSTWWQNRAGRTDRNNIKAAVDAGLITRSSGMLALTGKGTEMRHLGLACGPRERDAADLARRLRERRGV